MKMAFYAGAAGLMAQQQAMNTIGNNIANVNTNGYLPSNVSFSSLLNSEMYANTPNVAWSGNGARAVDMGLITNQGSYTNTSIPYDFAVVGDGFFAVNNGGEIQYTRDGAFNVALQGDAAYLSDIQGNYVLDAQQNPIQLVWDAEKGRYGYEGLTTQIGVFNFANPTQLTSVADNKYLQTAESGQAQVATNPEIMQGVLRASGVSLTEEMAQMILTQRAFQISSKVVQTADENEQLINNLRG